MRKLSPLFLKIFLIGLAGDCLCAAFWGWRLFYQSSDQPIKLGKRMEEIVGTPWEITFFACLCVTLFGLVLWLLTSHRLRK